MCRFKWINNRCRNSSGCLTIAFTKMAGAVLSAVMVMSCLFIVISVWLEECHNSQLKSSLRESGGDATHSSLWTRSRHLRGNDIEYKDIFPIVGPIDKIKVLAPPSKGTIDSIVGLAHLKSIEISNCGLESLTLARLASQPGLVSIKVSNCPSVSEQNLLWLRHSDQLWEVNLSGTGCGEDLAKILNQRSPILSISLRDSRLTNDGLSFVINTFLDLVRLDIAGTDVNPVGVGGVIGVQLSVLQIDRRQLRVLAESFSNNRGLAIVRILVADANTVSRDEGLEMRRLSSIPFPDAIVIVEYKNGDSEYLENVIEQAANE